MGRCRLDVKKVKEIFHMNLTPTLVPDTDSSPDFSDA